MTKLDFIAECVARLISPQVALENEDLVQALKDRNDLEIERILEEEF